MPIGFWAIHFELRGPAHILNFPYKKVDICRFKRQRFRFLVSDLCGDTGNGSIIMKECEDRFMRS